MIDSPRRSARFLPGKVLLVPALWFSLMLGDGLAGMGLGVQDPVEAGSKGEAPKATGEAEAAEGQDPKGQGKKDPVSLQARAVKKFKELESAMRRLADLLSTGPEKDRGKRLELGLRLARENRIREQMDEVAQAITDEDFQFALDQMAKVQKNLERLLNLLLERDKDIEELLEKIESYETFNKKLAELIKQQQKAKETSDHAKRLEKHLAELAKARKKAQELAAKQKGLQGDTKAKGTGEQESEELAERQKALEREARDLKARIQDLEADAKDLKKAAQGEGEGEGKGKGEGEGEGEGKGEGEGEGQGGNQSKGEASQAAGQAAKSMQQSGQKLDRDQPESSLDDQDEALDHLEDLDQALSDLEKDARRRLESIPFEKLAQEQDKTRLSTEDLADEMRKSEDGEGENKDEGEGDGEPIPGRRNVEQAVPKQKNAAGSLRRQKPGKAKEEQKDAEDDLREAKKKLEDALNQLRQELQEEVLRALEERFSEMLAKQKELTHRTGLLQKRRGALEALSAKGKIPASVAQACRKLAEGEHALMNSAKDALQLIKEEGSSAVFPEIVQELADLLELVASLLENFETGDEVAGSQKMIEQILEQLIEAMVLEMENKDNEGDGEGGSGEGEDNPLIQLIQELKMLKLLQLLVNAKTKTLDKLKPGSNKRKRLADKARGKQERTQELTRKLARKLEKQDEQDAEDDR